MAPPGKTSLRVVVGDDLETLADDLAEHLGSVHQAVLARDLIVVPTPGVGRWLDERLSHRLGASLLADGICANVDFLLWGGLLGRVLRRRRDEPDPWSVGSMTLTALGFLVDEAGQGAARLTPEAPGSLRFPVARATADLYDQLFRWRPDVADDWLDGDVPEPRAPLLRDLASSIATPPPHRALAIALEQLRADPDRTEVDLPDCVHVFGQDSMPGGPITTTVLESLASARDVVVHLMTPATTRFERILHETPRWGALPSSPPDEEGDDVLLVRSWGATSADAARLLAQLAPSSATSVTTTAPSRRSPDTLLGALQDAVRGRPAARRAPDTSVSLHACVGAARQAEAARDAILHAFVDDPRLKPADVAILCTDLPRFGPHLEAVLGNPMGAPDVPYLIRDRSLARALPYVAAVEHVLELLKGSMPRSGVVELLRSGYVQRRFDLDTEDVDRIASWSLDAGVHWGVDGAHRAERGLPETFDQGTWRRALDRLLAGVALPPGEPSDLLALRPLDVGHDLHRIGALCELFESLASLRIASRAPRDAAAWCDFVRDAAVTLLAPSFDEPRAGAALSTLLDGIERDATGTALPFEEFTAIVGDRVSSLRDLVATGRGGVTVTSFSPLRNVPFKVIVLLGLDDASLPIPVSPDSAFGPPRIGDRNRGADLRGALLASVLAARSRLIVTYDGRDVVTNEPIAPSTVMSELRDAIGLVCDDPDAVVRTHPRHAHGALDLLASPDGAPFAFDRGALRRAVELDGAQRTVTGPRFRAAAPEVDARVRTDELVEFLNAPQRTYLSALGVRLPRKRARDDDELPTSIDALERWELVQGLVRYGLEQGAGGLETKEWAAICDEWVTSIDGPMSGFPDRLAELALHGDDGVAVRAKRLCDAVLRLTGGKPPDVRALEVELPSGTTLVGEVLVYRGGSTVSWTASSNDAKLRVGAAVGLLALTVDDPATEWRAFRVFREGQKKSVDAPRLMVLGETPEARRERATRALEDLLDLRRRGLAEPLPLFHNVTRRLLWCLERDAPTGPEELAGAGLEGWASLYASDDSSEPAVRFCFDGTYDELLRLPVEPHDPPPHPLAGNSRLLASSLTYLDGILALDRDPEGEGP